MPIVFKKRVADLRGLCGADEAEPLLEWLQANPGGKVSLKHCEHLHTAVLQVLMAIRPLVSGLPDDPYLREWVMPAIMAATPRAVSGRRRARGDRHRRS